MTKFLKVQFKIGTLLQTGPVSDRVKKQPVPRNL